MIPLPSLTLLTSAAAIDPIAADLRAHGTILVAQGNGSQIYSCTQQRDATNWTLEGPSATLSFKRKRIGRHFAGPRWQLNDGSQILGRVTAQFQGANPSDIPELRVEVIAHEARGILDQANFVYRLYTHGGLLSGPCTTVGARRSVRYTAEYIFTS